MNEIEKPLKSANMHDVVQEWYAKFVEVPQETLFELILAANYMDIKPLLDLTCATVASMIKVSGYQIQYMRFSGSNSPQTQSSESWSHVDVHRVWKMTALLETSEVK